MLIPSCYFHETPLVSSLSRRVNANSQRTETDMELVAKLIKKGEC